MRETGVARIRKQDALAWERHGPVQQELSFARAAAAAQGCGGQPRSPRGFRTRAQRLLAGVVVSLAVGLLSTGGWDAVLAVQWNSVMHALNGNMWHQERTAVRTAPREVQVDAPSTGTSHRNRCSMQRGKLDAFMAQVFCLEFLRR